MAVVQPAARPPDPAVRMEAAAVLLLLEALGRGPGAAAAEDLLRQLVRLGAAPGPGPAGGGGGEAP